MKAPFQLPSPPIITITSELTNISNSIFGYIPKIGPLKTPPIAASLTKQEYS